MGITDKDLKELKLRIQALEDIIKSFKIIPIHYTKNEEYQLLGTDNTDIEILP